MPNDRIALGSGDLYALLYTSGSIPADNVIETEANRLGAIQGGASIEYKATFYDAIDDSGKRSKTIVTDEEAVLKSGVMTWNGNTLKKLSQTARVTEANGKRTVKIGGVGMQNGDKYIIRFVHHDAVDGDCRLTILGSNRAGLALAFAKNKETVINAEFRAMPSDTDGTLIIYEEDIIDPTMSELTALTVGSTISNLSPSFDADTLEYTAAASGATGTVTATGKTGATVTKKVNGTTFTSSANLDTGVNDILIEVQNGINKRTYHIAVTRS